MGSALVDEYRGVVVRSRRGRRAARRTVTVAGRRDRTDEAIFFLVALFDRLFETDLIEKCCVDGRFG